MTRLDRAALRQGALTSLLFGVPCSIAARLVADRSDGSLATVLSLAALAGFFVGAGVAAWLQQAGTPLSHGIICATGTYTVAQAVFVVVKLARGGEVRWLGVLFNLSAVLFVGTIGGLVGSALQRRGIAPRPGGRREP
ncbi:MAG: hypothetical protein ACO3C1_10815 [Ilumatobacteraceae bacterium]